MELDKRIKEGKRPLTCFDLKEAEQFIGKKGYFAHCIDYYEDLKSTVFGTLGRIEDTDHSSFVCTEETFDNYYYHFFIPEDWVLPAEPKYRAYTLDEFIGDMNLGVLEPWIRMRHVKAKKELKLLYTGYMKTEVGDYICLGSHSFDLITLYKEYEIKDFDGKWQPFGVLEND